jgi:hypothetical protein
MGAFKSRRLKYLCCKIFAWEDRRMAFSRVTLSVVAVVAADLTVRLFFRETPGWFLIEAALTAVGISIAWRFGTIPNAPTWAKAPRVLTAGFLKQLKMGKRAPANATAQLPPEPSLQSLPTWPELEQRFKELDLALQSSRIDIVVESSGEHFTIAGAADPESVDRFKAVASIAGARLQRDFPDEIHRHQQLAQESDPLMIWYKALQYIGGSGAATVFIGSIDRPAAASVNLCLTMASRAR